MEVDVIINEDLSRFNYKIIKKLIFKKKHVMVKRLIIVHS